MTHMNLLDNTISVNYTIVISGRRLMNHARFL